MKLLGSGFYLGAGVLAIVAIVVAGARCKQAPTSSTPAAPPGCEAECPTPPAGCERTSIDPGACSSACKTPAPVCHYAPVDAAAVCPATLAGRCIPPQ